MEEEVPEATVVDEVVMDVVDSTTTGPQFVAVGAMDLLEGAGMFLGEVEEDMDRRPGGPMAA